MWSKEKICDFCGKKFTIYHKKRNTGDVYCSRKCSANSKKSNVLYECPICGKEFHIKPKRVKRLKDKNICCSKRCDAIKRRESQLGMKNSNFKHEKDFSSFYNLDKFGAYVLGFIWSDGHISQKSYTISLFQKERQILDQISNKIFKECLVKKIAPNIYGLSINDKEFMEYVLSLGGIKRGKKSHMVEIPNIPEDLKWPFICGYFDGDGGFAYDYKYPKISIYSNSHKIMEQIAFYWGVNYTGRNIISASGNKALDICGKMYSGMPITLNRKHDYYLSMLNWEPLPGAKWQTEEFFKFKKISKEAIAPQKKRVTDSGYDVHAIIFEPFNEEAGIYMADMRVAIEPIKGWYFDLIGRSSLPQNNLHFLGGVGVIDRSYVGSIKMMVQKIDKEKPLPDTPFKCGQLIPRKIIHLEFVEVDELSASEREDNGFGSSGV